MIASTKGRSASFAAFHHREHTVAFWDEVDKVVPDYRDRKDWLRKNGAELDV